MAFVSTRKWSGKNVSETSGFIPELNKIYTTVGLKDIAVKITGLINVPNLGQQTFTSLCSTSTTIKLDTGTNQER